MKICRLFHPAAKSRRTNLTQGAIQIHRAAKSGGRSPRHVRKGSWPSMSAFTQETVLSVYHWTDELFSFTATRSPSLRFESGQFVMIGLEVEGKPLVRAYSMVSPNYDDKLEFLSIKVQGGPLTSRLQHIQPGSTILVGRKPTGTLVLDFLTSGRNLYLLASGTGLAPFLSVIRDPQTYERHERVILAHSVRMVADLAYRDVLTKGLEEDELLGEVAAGKLAYYPTVTREPFEHQGRLTDLITSGRLLRDLDLPPLEAAKDRVMICGGPQMLQDLRQIVLDRGFAEGSSGEPGTFVIEKAFVEK
jgi:ferredoxin--NADP+ reductase